MKVRRLAERSMFLAGALVLGLATLSAQAAESVLRHDPRDGFVTLAVQAGLVKVGASAVAENRGELEHVWQTFELSAPIPRVDFALFVVLLFSELDMCQRGLGGLELEGLRMLSDGRLEPEFAATTRTCDFIGSTPPAGVVYTVAVRRHRLPSGHRLTVGPGRVARPPGTAVRRTRVPIICESKPPSSELGAGPDSILSLPERPGVLHQYLRDGSGVFVVRHEDGTYDVLASDVLMRANYPGTDVKLEGLRAGLNWHCGSRRFWSVDGSFDEYGVPARPTFWQSVDRYRAVPQGDGTLRVPPGARHDGYGYRPVAPAPRADTQPYYVPEYPVESLTADLHDALRRPIGSRLFIDSMLILDPGSGPVFCKPLSQFCIGRPVPALGIKALGATRRYHLRGIFAVRVSERGFADVTLVGHGGWPIHRVRAFDWDGLELEAAVAAFAAGGTAGGGLGGEVKLTARTGPWTPWQHGLGTWLIGRDAGLALRARLLAPLSAPATELFLGLDPVFDNPDASRRWLYPSPLGALLPEFGAAHDDDGTYPYLGWTLPVEFHFEPWRTRQHPYRAMDVLGIELTPTALLSFRGDGQRWLFGAALGATLW